MGKMALRVLGVMAIGLLLCASGTSFAQEGGEESLMPSDVETPAPAVPVAEPSAEFSGEPVAPQWIWGEVVSVDSAASQVQIKHLDYDTYEEVTKVINVDSGTLFENVSGINEVQAGDSVTVDFRVKAGAQVAELIVVDKSRAPVEPKDEPTMAPAEAQEPVGAPEAVTAPLSTEEQDLLAGSPAPVPDLNEPMLPSVTEFLVTPPSAPVEAEAAPEPSSAT